LANGTEDHQDQHQRNYRDGTEGLQVDLSAGAAVKNCKTKDQKNVDV
jgi:hypothetical protein